MMQTVSMWRTASLDDKISEQLLPCVFLIGGKRTLLFQGWFQKKSRQEQRPSCSVHKDLTLRMVWKPDRMEYFSYFLYS